MHVVAVLNPKGGCGKTTVSTNLARALQVLGKQVLLVDTDPQGSARDWHAAHENNPVPLVALDRPQSLRGVEQIARGYDFVILDGAAKLEDMLAAAIRVATVVLIPVQPSPYDIWAAADLVEIIRTRQEVTNGQPQAAFVVTRAIANTKLGVEVVEALADHDLPVFRSSTHQRVIYANTASVGEAVVVTAGPAADEVFGIAGELLELLGEEGARAAQLETA